MFLPHRGGLKQHHGWQLVVLHLRILTGYGQKQKDFSAVFSRMFSLKPSCLPKQQSPKTPAEKHYFS